MGKGRVRPAGFRCLPPDVHDQEQPSKRKMAAGLESRIGEEGPVHLAGFG